MARLDSFRFTPGKKISNKYEIIRLLGQGWEGEVYLIRELDTGIERAAKFFFPQRNPGNRTAKSFAKKLYRMRHCDLVVQYLNQENLTVKGHKVSCLISEFVEGEMLDDFMKRHPGKRLPPFKALHIFHKLVEGVESIHSLGEYHGDLHTNNVMIKQYGIGFQLKIIDPFDWKDSKSLNRKKDILDLIRILYDMVGGAKHYRNMPDPIKSICNGLKKTLIEQKFRKAAELRNYTENMEW
jgi:hypothetical protein